MSGAWDKVCSGTCVYFFISHRDVYVWAESSCRPPSELTELPRACDKPLLWSRRMNLRRDKYATVQERQEIVTEVDGPLDFLCAC